MHSVGGDDDGINGLPLTAMRGHCIAMREAPIDRGERPSVIQLNPTLGLDGGHRDQFAIGDSQPRATTVRSQ